MNAPTKLAIYLSLAFTLINAPAKAETVIEGSIKPFLAPASLSLHKVFEKERFPNIVVTTKGTLVATFGSGSVNASRSEDGGTTWSSPITVAQPGFHGGGTTVDEQTGDILAFVEERHPPAPIVIYRSSDDGKSWKAQETTFHADPNGNKLSMHMNDKGITLRHGKHKGRLLRPARWYGKRNAREEWPTHYTSAIYSDDHGKTWHASAPFPENGTGEACVAELANGTVYYNSRVHWEKRPKNRRRREAWSQDGGQSWMKWKIIESLPDGPQDTNYGCMGGIARLNVKDRDILIYSNCDSPSGRKNGHAWGSFDGGKTWPVKRRIFEGRFAYSSATSGRPGTPTEGWIYVHFEGGPKGASTVAKFNLSWLLAGEATGDGTIPAEFAR